MTEVEVLLAVSDSGFDFFFVFFFSFFSLLSSVVAPSKQNMMPACELVPTAVTTIRPLPSIT